MKHSNYIKDKHKNIEDYNYQKSRNNDSFCWFDCNSKKTKNKKNKSKNKKNSIRTNWKSELFLLHKYIPNIKKVNLKLRYKT